jgi:hypothetical protein
MSDETPQPVSQTIRILALVLGVVCYVGALLLGWLAEAPSEVVEPLKGLAYAVALMSPSVQAAIQDLRKP